MIGKTIVKIVIPLILVDLLIEDAYQKLLDQFLS
jgi:hypothetical protein